MSFFHLYYAWRLCRVPQLVALLDVDTCFPVAPFESEEALAALSRLGMQSIIGQESILQSARYVAELGLQDPDQAHERYLPRLNIPSLLAFYISSSYIQRSAVGLHQRCAAEACPLAVRDRRVVSSTLGQ